MSNTRRFWERLAVDFCSRDLLLEDPLFEAPAYSSFQFDLDEDIDHDAYNRWFAWCRTCRRPFVRITPNKKFCSLECARPTSRNNKRTEVRAAHEIKFVGIDGEGISVKDSNGKIIHHYYVLIVANGIGVEPLVLHKNGERLTTEEIFEWLYNVVFAAHPDACFVTYSMGYDLSQWIKDLPESRARMLFTKQGIASRKRRNSANPTPFPVYWRPDRGSPREWELDTLGTKRLKFRVRERGWRNFSGQDGDRETETKAPPWMYINDVFSFFQCSFIKAIDPAPRLKAGTPSIVTAEEFATILYRPD